MSGRSPIIFIPDLKTNLAALKSFNLLSASESVPYFTLRRFRAVVVYLLWNIHDKSKYGRQLGDWKEDDKSDPKLTIAEISSLIKFRTDVQNTNCIKRHHI